ncbi:hypothetical protein [Curvivirga aplysinae]|nr:hypothetical protein [Curvivirga aplysinae]
MKPARTITNVYNMHVKPRNLWERITLGQAIFFAVLGVSLIVIAEVWI